MDYDITPEQEEFALREAYPLYREWEEEDYDGGEEE